MTEAEAKTKWCPMARVIWGQAAVNRELFDGSAPTTCLCLASQCMAWRWDTHKDGQCGLAGARGAM
jgi:hypothetical protein